MRLKWFQPDEFACRCGCGGLPQTELMQWADELRESLKEPIFITSGYRCEAYNRTIGGSENSQHVKGLAMDVRVPSAAYRYAIMKLALEHGARGLGFYDAKHGNFIHLDVRKEPPVSWVN